MVTTCENAQCLLMLLVRTVISRLAIRTTHVCICMALTLSPSKKWSGKFCLSVTIRNQPSYAGKKISRVIREIFCNNKEASA